MVSKLKDAIIKKYNAYNCFDIFKTSFGYIDWGHVESVENSDRLILVGTCTDICVVSNALLLKAFLPEVEITVDASCCAGVTPESHKNALQVMKSCQIKIINE